MQLDEALELKHKVFMVRLGQLSVDVNGEQFSVFFFIEFNGDNSVLLFVCVHYFPVRGNFPGGSFCYKIPRIAYNTGAIQRG